MRNPFQHWIREFLTLHKNEQRGIAVLLLLLVFLLLFQWFLPSFFPAGKEDFSRYDRAVSAFVTARKKMEDSLHLLRLQKSGKLSVAQARQLLHPFPFYPNRLNEKQCLQLGLNARQARTIMRYLARGGHFRQKEDFQKIHGISSAEYTVLEPYIRLDRSVKTPKVPKKRIRHQTELNSADTSLLRKNLLLPAWLCARIVKYRHLLGGFYTSKQLLEVYGMKASIYRAVERYVVIDTAKIRKINLNTASFKQLLHHPYIDYVTTKKLLNARNKAGGFRSFQQVREMTGLADSLMNKIHHYLYLRPLKN